MSLISYVSCLNYDHLSLIQLLSFCSFRFITRSWRVPRTKHLRRDKTKIGIGIGIKGPLLHWFFSYLDKRLQPVVIDGKSCDWLPVSSGVPQGSLLGPALFVLFTNDMPNALSHSSTLALFADDAKCFRTIRS